MPSITRFGRAKKSPKPDLENANSATRVLAPSEPFQAPRISLLHVETELNMSQYNGLFEGESPDRQKGSGASENTMGWSNPITFLFSSK